MSKKLKDLLRKEFKGFLSIYRRNEDVTKSARQFADKLGIEYTDSVRRMCSMILSEKGVKEDKVTPIEQTTEYKEILKNRVKKSKYYLITQAQAETPINRGFWDKIKMYSEFIGAEIIVQPSRYKNPTSLEANSRQK